MSNNELTAVWAEIESMKQEMASLKIRREVLTNHMSELETLHSELEHSARRVEGMMKQVTQALSE